MNNRLFVSPSPHVFGSDSTSKLMLSVILALMPAFAVSMVVYGLNAVIVTAVSIASCVLFEWLIVRFMLKSKNTVCNLSAVLTGLLLAFNLPAAIPLWMVVIGALVAIGVGKMSFGGLGRNPFNPALVGRVFLLLSFPVAMTWFPGAEGVAWPVMPGADIASGATALTDATSGATPLTFVKEALKNGHSASLLSQQFTLNDMLFGFKGGSFGELGALALLLGGLYLLIRRTISWHIPVAVLGSMALMSGILWGISPDKYMGPAFQLLTGGALLGAIYMATDYVTSPMTHKGMLIFGVGIGILTIIIRVWGAYPEGMSFAILIMNAFVPLINKYVKPRRFDAKA